MDFLKIVALERWPLLKDKCVKKTKVGEVSATTYRVITVNRDRIDSQMVIKVIIN